VEQIRALKKKKRSKFKLGFIEKRWWILYSSLGKKKQFKTKQKQTLIEQSPLQTAIQQHM